ncbi:MAG: DUF6531 domain-containing protein [Paucimonas sp.]|jgi:YD repeat-containing protein|nr:DUF6531 domain-containing protein [Paucimonas sp.]
MDSSGPFESTEPVEDLPKPEEPVPLTEEMTSLEEFQVVNPANGIYPEYVVDPEQNLGEPEGQSCAGNPINTATGNKFQSEVDIPKRNPNSLEMVRYYNSQRAVHWSHTYSAYIKSKGSLVRLQTAEGAALKFKLIQGTTYTPLSEESIGKLLKTSNGWEYQNTDKDISRFDAKGRLVQWAGHTGYGYSLVYSGNTVTITDIYTKSISLTHDSYGRLSIARNPVVTATYQYDKGGRLTGVAYNYSGKIKSRQYGYDDTRFPFHLTSITDERGVVAAQWTYDSRGRAISSVHAGGADLTTMAYNDLGATTITNSLGKQSTHSFEVIKNVKRLVRVQGHPSLNCGLSNASFKYDSQGRRVEKLDEMGTKTLYSYNAQGHEISRTEAAGTPLARVITTQRDADGIRPITITEPGKTTQFRYNAKGQLIEMTVQ